MVPVQSNLVALPSVGKSWPLQHCADSQRFTKPRIKPKSIQSPSNTELTPHLPWHYLLLNPNGTSRAHGPVPTEGNEMIAEAVASWGKEAGIVSVDQVHVSSSPISCLRWWPAPDASEEGVRDPMWDRCHASLQPARLRKRWKQMSL